jgi:copper chaperone CopZ
MRFALLAPWAVLLAACSDCEHCNQSAPPEKPVATAAATPGGAAPAAEAPAAEWTIVEDDAPPKPPEVKVAWRGEGPALELSVWHMHCGGCALKVENAFKEVPGVKDAVADHETSVVKVTLADAAQRDAVIARLPEALRAVNERSGKDFRVLGL